MNSQTPPVTGFYDYCLVVLSVVIAILAAYAALDLAGRVTAARGNIRLLWLGGGAFAMGTGIWSMHYIGMLAFRLPVAVAYDWPTVLLSLLAAMFASGVALWVVSRNTMGIASAGAECIVMGGGIAAMHYIGMEAMRLPAMCMYSTGLVVLSIVMAVVISFVGLWLAFRSRNDTAKWSWQKSGSMRLIIFLTAMLPVLLMTGCAVSTPVSTTIAVTAGSSGRVAGGQQPVANASIHLYSVGTTGVGTSATPLLSKVVVTDENGNFNIAGLYSCAGATEVFLTAIGGDPAPGVNNPDLAMMTALGPCTSLNPQTPIVVNELTTVAAIYALEPYMTSSTGLGSSSEDSASLDEAFTLASELVNPQTGVSPGSNVPSGDTVPNAEIDALGDLVAPCINSGGGIAGDGSPCGNLFRLTTPSGLSAPSNTIAALLNLADHPDVNTGALYQLIGSNAPFQPFTPSVPSSFAISTSPIPPSTPIPPAPPVPPPTLLELSPASINFPATAPGSAAPEQGITLTNGGTAEVPISSIVISGVNSVDFPATNNCPVTLVAGASCAIQVSFSPQSASNATATLQVNAGLATAALSGGVASPGWPLTLLAANPSVYLNFNDDTANFLDQSSGETFSVGGGAVSPSQPGFDNTTPNNTSAGFAWNAWNKAGSNTLGDIEWNVPWTMMIQIDRLNWNRTGTLVLASKGDISKTSNNWWELTLGMSGGLSQLCFTRNGVGVGYHAQNGICTGNLDTMPNAFNYNIVVEDNGSGGSSALSLYINGLEVQGGATPQIPGGAFSRSYANGFGYVNISVSGGVGYANSTAFTSTGGGPNCNVTGFMAANNGVPYNGNWTPTGSSNFGCTSDPMIVLTSPTGTGALITATLGGTSMNSTTYPLMVPGFVSGGTYYGVAGPNSTQTPIYIDEFAIFPGNLNQTQVQTLFYQTKFYQGIVNQATPKPVVIVDDDTYSDMDNEFNLEMAIGLHEAGLITLAGVVVDSNAPGSAAGWRQMLDSAGLQNVPVSIPPGYPSGDPPPTSILTAYNASTPMTLAAYESSTTMYRTIFAEYPTTPIKVLLGAPNWLGFADFMQSPADSTSPLTGLQMVAQNGANGGAAYGQGYLWDTSATGAYVVANNQTMPIIWIGGTPMVAGPGVLSTRASNDPMYLFAKYVGTDIRQCYDCLMMESAVSSLFDFGVQITYSGGAGYANSTPFTLSGGGPNCQGNGFMSASGGVPNGILFNWGQSAVGSYSGIGSGCTSAPTVNLIGATGTGVTLTATPSPCGQITVSSGTAAFGTTTCTNQYVTPGSFNTDQSPVSGAVMTWFINSLVDPTP